MDEVEKIMQNIDRIDAVYSDAIKDLIAKNPHATATEALELIEGIKNLAKTMLKLAAEV